LRIGHFFNIANIGYSYVSFLRKMKYDAELITDKNDFIMAHPQWEEGDFELGDLSLFGPRWKASDTAPPWVRYVAPNAEKLPHERELNKAKRFLGTVQILLRSQRTKPVVCLADVMRFGVGSWDEFTRFPGAVSFAQRWAESASHVVKAMREYDVLHAWWLGPQYAMFSKIPYIAHPAGGDITMTAFENNLRGRLLREGYKKARFVVVGAPQILEASKRLRLNNTYQMNLMIDTDKYRPLQSDLRNRLGENRRLDYLIYSPARQDWFWKGNHKLIGAFSRLIMEHNDGMFLLLTEWGNDVHKSKQLMSKLGVERNVGFTKPVAKGRLVRYYNAADVVVDSLGSYGYLDMSMLEAMSCGKPVVTYISEDKYAASNFRAPPVLNAITEEEVYEHLSALVSDRNALDKAGAMSREYAIRYHDWHNLIHELEELYELAAGRS